MKKQIIKKTRAFINLVVDSGITVSSAYLYGSYAKGTAKNDSDIDVGVVSPAFGKNYWKEMTILKNLASKVDLRIEPIPFSEKDINDRYYSLAGEVKKFGIKINIH